MSGQQYDIFMSHKKQDKSLVKQIGTHLLDVYSVRCWLDEWDISAGKDWELEIEKALSGCSACAVCLGGNGWGNYHLREAQFAIERMRQHPDYLVIPVLLPGVREEDMGVLGDFFKRKHRVDFSNGINDESAIQSLVSAIRGEAQGPPSMTAFTIRRDAQRWDRSPSDDKSLLYHGYELQEAQKIAAQFTENLNELAIKFLAASAAEERRALQSEQRRNRIIITILSLLLLAFIGSTAYAFKKRSDAEQQTKIANEQREEAVKQTEIAREQSELAEQRREAEQTQRSIAESQTRIAEVRRKDADKQRQRAEEQTHIAEDRRQEAERQKRQAQLQEQAAQRERLLAESRGLVAESRRLVAEGDIDEARVLLRTAAREEAGLMAAQGPVSAGLILKSSEPVTYVFPTYQFDGVGSIAFSSDGTRLATGGLNGQVWNVGTGSLIATLNHTKEKYAYIRDIAYSSDGSRIATASQMGTALWEANTGTLISVLDPDNTVSVVFSPDGSRLVTILQSGVVQLWNAKTGNLIVTLETDSCAKDDCIAFSPNSSRVITIDKTHSSGHLWDATTGKLVATLGGVFGESKSAFSPDGERLVVGSDLWDAGSGKLISQLGKLAYGLISVAFAPDGSRFVTGSWSGAGLWDGHNGALITSLRGHTDRVFDVTFSADGKLFATAGVDGARLWHTRTGSLIANLEGHSGFVIQCKFSPDNSLLATSSNDSTRVWDTRIGDPIVTLRSNTGLLGVVTFSPDGKYLATSGYKSPLRLWDTRQRLNYDIIGSRSKPREFLGMSSDGKLLLTRLSDGTGQLWDLPEVNPIVKLKSKLNNLSQVEFAPKVNRLVTFDLLDVKLWDARSGDMIAIVEGRPINSFGLDTALSPDGSRLVTFKTDGTMLVSDTITGENIATDL